MLKIPCTRQTRFGTNWISHFFHINIIQVQVSSIAELETDECASAEPSSLHYPPLYTPDALAIRLETLNTWFIKYFFLNSRSKCHPRVVGEDISTPNDIFTYEYQGRRSRQKANWKEENRSIYLISMENLECPLSIAVFKGEFQFFSFFYK